MAAGIIHDGSKTVTAAGTAEPLSSTSVKCNWIMFQPLDANLGDVYIGASTVTATRGIVVRTGDTDVAWPLVALKDYDLNSIYIDAANSGDGVQFIYVAI